MKNSLKGLLNEVKVKLNEDEAQEELKSILKKDYKAFVGELGDNVKDPKFIDAIKSLSDTAPVKVTSGKQ